MNSQFALAMLEQIADGKDIPPPTSLLNRISISDASALLPHHPYSIATNLAHAVFWQDVWMARLEGGKAPRMTEDWRTPDIAAWPDLRDRFLEGFERARALAAARPFVHAMKSDAAAETTLIRLAIHDAYHLGQINLLKRALRLSRARR